MNIEFVIRDRTGHSTVLVPPEQADAKADELRDHGYLLIVDGKLIAYGESVQQYKKVEAIPLATAG